MKFEELPKNLEAEQAIFSILLFNQDRFIDVVDTLSPTDFYSEAHQTIWQAMTELFKSGQELDIVAIRAQIKKQEINSAPAMQALMESVDNTGVSFNLKHFVKEVKDKSTLRQIMRVTQAQFYNAQLDNAEPNVVLADIEKSILEIVDKTSDSRPVHAHGIIDEVKADIKTTQEQGWQGYSTGFNKLDISTGGFIPTQNWIVGAYTGTGKTFFVLQMLLNVLRQGGKVILFSTEMDRKLVMIRLLGNIAGLGTINIMRGKLLPNEQEELEHAQDEVASFAERLTIYDNVYTLAEIRLKVKKAKLTHGLDLVAVDFIQNLRGGESIYERMSEAAIGLQQLAQEAQVTMIIASQVSQQAAGWSSKESIDFKGAGEIAAIADVALWISKDKDGDPSIRKVMLRKIRHGAPGKFETRLSFPSGRVIDMEQAVAIEDKEDTDNVTKQL